MPGYIDPGGNIVEQILGLQRLVNSQRDTQVSNILAKSKPGQTWEEAGFTPTLFQHAYGRAPMPGERIGTPTSQQKTDDLVNAFLDQLSPEQKLNLSASIESARAGQPGLTTAQGLQDAMATGGVEAATKRKIAESTADTTVKTAQTQAATGLVKAGTEQTTAVDIANRVKSGIDAMSKETPTAQKSLNEKLAYGSTGQELDQQNMKVELANSSLRQAIKAQADPNHPLNGWLKKQGLDINTVMAGTAMGLNNMMENWAHSILTLQVQNKEAQNIVLRSRMDLAKDMSEKLGMKVSPNQILAVMDARESGKGVPKGLEGVAAVLDNSADALYNAAINKALKEGDPFVQSMTEQLDNIKRVKDLGQLQMANDLARTMAAYSVARQYLPAPVSPDDFTRFDTFMKMIKDKVPVTDIQNAWWKPNSFNLRGMGTGQTQAPPVPAPDATATPPKQPTGGTNPLDSLSDKDKKQLMDFLQLFVPQQPAAGNTP